MNKVLEEWQNAFKEVSDRLSNSLLHEAKKKSKTYREASTYIKRVAQLSYGDITEAQDRSARTINSAICDLALYKLHEEERDMPIKEMDK